MAGNGQGRRGRKGREGKEMDVPLSNLLNTLYWAYVYVLLTTVEFVTMMTAKWQSDDVTFIVIILTGSDVIAPSQQHPAAEAGDESSASRRCYVVCTERLQFFYISPGAVQIGWAKNAFAQPIYREDWPGLDLPGGLGVETPVYVYKCSFWSENRFSIPG